MISIDGALGEGGGQILRTTLALAMCTGQAVRIVNIRAKRDKPGLLRQHLTALQAAAQICDARVEGDSIGSGEISFAPGVSKAGEYTFSVGTAGSTNLVLQTILPALLQASGPSTLVLEGGTHNPFAPPFDFIQQVFLPLLERMGPRVQTELERPGFYPAGGGRWTVHITPAAALKPLVLNERGAILERKATAVRAGLPGHIAARELKTVGKMLSLDEENLQHRQFPAAYGPGNYLSIMLRCEHITELFIGFGQYGMPAEKVAKACVQQARRYLAAGVPVAEYLADQLLLPLALAGAGEFVSVRPSRHTLTNIEVIQKLLPVRISCEQQAEDAFQFAVNSS